MDPQYMDENYEHIESLVERFCKIILTKKDKLNIDGAKKYIDSLTPEDITALNTEKPDENQQIRSIVLKQIAEYIQSYFQEPTPSFQRPFEFDSGGIYVAFCQTCSEYYQNNHQRNSLPSILKFTLQYIQEMSEHYRIFGHFYDVHSKQTSNQIVEQMAKTAEDKANAVIKNMTKESAEIEVQKSVEEKMIAVTTKISETSVTILGIFSGIVLTVVAGLFYSSSVLENINAANFFKLICTASLVGLVCHHLLVVMFRFIERIKSDENKKDNGKSDTKPNGRKDHTIFISIVLIVIFIITCVLQFIFPNNSDNSTSSTPIDSTVNVDVFFDSNTQNTDETNSAETTTSANRQEKDNNINNKN